jgi:hypothetical protein
VDQYFKCFLTKRTESSFAIETEQLTLADIKTKVLKYVDLLLLFSHKASRYGRNKKGRKTRIEWKDALCRPGQRYELNKERCPGFNGDQAYHRPFFTTIEKEKTMDIRSKYKMMLLIGAGVMAAGTIMVYAATYQGAADYIGLWQGPAQLTGNDALTTPANFTGPWHYHPGFVYNVVKQGTVLVEDGCGGSAEYGPGDAFETSDGRVHRAVNPHDIDEVEISMSINAPGRPTRVVVPAGTCGPAANVDECKDGGWARFNHPSPFSSQGQCVAYVNNRKRVSVLVPEDPLQ